MSLPSTLVSVPTRGAIHNQTISRLELIRDTHPEVVGPIAYCAGHLSSHETREEIVKYFLTTDHEVLIMLDDDVVPPTHMLRLRQWFKEFDIVGAAVPMFQPKVSAIPMLMAWDYYPEEKSWRTLNDVWGKQGIVECDGVGFGCVAIHRRVFEEMDAPYFRLEQDATGRTITDDLSFCRRARELGYKVACDFEVKCEHFSTVGLLELSVGVSGLIDATLEAHGVVLREPEPVAPQLQSVK